MVVLAVMVAVLCVDIGAFFYLLQLLRRRGEKEREESVTFQALALSGLAIFSAHFIGLGLLFQLMPGQAILLIAMTIFPGMPAALLWAWLMLDRVTHAGANHAFGLGTTRAPESDFSAAKATYMKGDIDGAVAQYQAVFRLDPSSPRALFEIVQLLMKEGRTEDQATVLRQIIAQFRTDDLVWARATMELAAYLQNDLGDREAARLALIQVRDRVPETEFGYMAKLRVFDLEAGK